jgi:hypothetical protein
MLALGHGACAGCLNFPDSMWLLAMPPPSALLGLDDARRATLKVVAEFQRCFRTCEGQ